MTNRVAWQRLQHARKLLMNSTFQPLTDLPLTVSVRRVVALAAVAGYVEVIGFLEIDGI